MAEIDALQQHYEALGRVPTTERQSGETLPLCDGFGRDDAPDGPSCTDGREAKTTAAGLRSPDRHISVWKAAHHPRTIDYPFTFIELRVGGDDDGEGERKLSLTTRVIATSDGRFVQLEPRYAAAGAVQGRELSVTCLDMAGARRAV